MPMLFNIMTAHALNRASLQAGQTCSHACSKGIAYLQGQGTIRWAPLTLWPPQRSLPSCCIQALHISICSSASSPVEGREGERGGRGKEGARVWPERAAWMGGGGGGGGCEDAGAGRLLLAGQTELYMSTEPHNLAKCTMMQPTCYKALTSNVAMKRAEC